MSTKYYIILVNNTDTSQRYSVFMKPPEVTITSTLTSPEMFTNVWLNCDVGVGGRTIISELQFNNQAWCGNGGQTLSSGTVVPGGSSYEQFSLRTPDQYGSALNIEIKYIEGDFKYPEFFSGVGSPCYFEGCFSITTTCNVLESDNYLSGLCTSDPISVNPTLVPTSSFQLQPSQTYTINSVVTLYFSKLQYALGTALNYAAASTAGVEIDFTGNPGSVCAILTLEPDGSINVAFQDTAPG